MFGERVDYSPIGHYTRGRLAKRGKSEVDDPEEEDMEKDPMEEDPVEEDPIEDEPMEDEDPEEKKVSFAAFMFKGEAKHWWRANLRLERAAQRQIDWDRFVELMNKKYIPEGVRDQCAIEFQELQQNNMTIQEYEAKFTQLLRFAPHLIAEESDKAKKFQRGLRGNIRGKLVALRIRNYAELVETAFEIEKDQLEYQEIRNKKQSSAKRPRTEGGPTTDKSASN